jgi:ribosome-associated protein
VRFLRIISKGEIMKEVNINTEYITLGQFLKLADIIQSGGEAKLYLSETNVLINGESDNRRGRKLRDGDVILVEDVKYIIKQCL